MAIGEFSLRAMLGRLGQGALQQGHSPQGQPRFYLLGDELLSVRETFERHREQDGAKGGTDSVRRWVETHCDPRDYATVWRERDFAKTVTVETWPEWNAVTTEQSRCLAGLQGYSRVTYTDFPTSHETRDWNWDIYPDPQFTYMLTDHQTGLLANKAQTVSIHNEWESGSMPLQWRPFCGEYITQWGRHIWDQGHPPFSCELHPVHTIVREHTTAAPLGTGGAMVPATRAIIGMGLSGGFPGRYGDKRWKAEFGGVPDDVWGDTTDCWPTNLKLHPLRHRLYPPVPRPSPTATLKWRIVLVESIAVSSFSKLDDFLERCQHDDPAAGGGDLAFRIWDRARNLPHGFTPATVPPGSPCRPRLEGVKDHQGQDAAFELRVDLNEHANIPVGYYAIVEVGWSEPGSHTLRQWELKFVSVRADETDEWWDDWHMYFGVNGQWEAWFTDDDVEEGDSYTHNKAFQFWTVGDQPIVIRDCGVEWDGTDPWNEKLDRVEIDAPGPNHFASVKTAPGVTVLSEATNFLRFKAKGTKSGDTKHTWTLELRRLS